MPHGQLGQHVVTGLLAPLLDETGQVHAQFHPGVVGLALPFGGIRVRIGVQARGEGVRPGVEAGLVLAWHPQQSADHGYGERVGELVDQVDAFGVSEVVDQPGDDGAEVAPHPVDAAWGVRRPEGPVGHPAQPVVLGRIQLEEARREGRGLLLATLGQWVPGRRGQVAGVGAESRVVQQALDLVVGADDVRPAPVVEDGSLAQFFVQGVRVRAVGVVQDLAQDAVGHCGPPGACGSVPGGGERHPPVGRMSIRSG